MKRPRSLAIFEKATSLIPGGVNSPVRSFKGLGLTPPMIAESGAGAKLLDADGNTYIDYCMSWGALILGHAHPRIVEAAIHQMRRGSSFGIATNLEVELAEKIAALVPSVEKTRLVSSGTEAAMTALRLARGYTEKPKILKFSGHYHGHSDALLVQAGSGVAQINSIATSKGINPAILADTLVFPFNDFQMVRSFFRTDSRAENLAAVILEPVTGNMGVVLPEAGFLEMLREETARAGALLIFDEVITGFRLGLSGAQGLFGIEPDLTCFGKVIGGGFPVAGVGGKKKILDCLAPLGEVYQAGTLSGNPVAVAAGIAALKEVEKPGFYQALEEKANRVTGPVKEAIRAKNLNACVNQCGSMFSLFFGIREEEVPKNASFLGMQVKSKEDLAKLDAALFVRLFRTLFERGIYLPPSSHESWFVSSAHTESELDFTAHQIVDFIRSL